MTTTLSISEENNKNQIFFGLSLWISPDAHPCRLPQ